MYFFCIYIPFLSQNIQLNEQWFQRFYQDLTGLLKICNFHQDGQSHDCLFFRISVEIIHDPKQIVYVATRIKQMLVQWEHFIEGYTVIFDYNIDTSYNPNLDHISLIVKNKEKNCILITNTIAMMVQVTLGRSRQNCHTLEEVRATLRELPIETFAAPESLVRHTKRVLASWMSETRTQRNIGIVYGLNDDGIEMVVQKALSLIPYVCVVRLRREAVSNELMVIQQFTEVLYRLSHSDASKESGNSQNSGDEIAVQDSLGDDWEVLNSAMQSFDDTDAVSFRFAENSYKTLCAIARECIHLLQRNHADSFFVCHLTGVYEWRKDVEDAFFEFLDVVDPERYMQILSHTNKEKKTHQTYLYIRWYYFKAESTEQEKSLRARKKNERHHLVYYYLKKRFRQFGWHDTKELASTKSLLARMPKRFLRVLFIIRMLGTWAVQKRILPILEKERVSQGQVVSLLRVLMETGILNVSGKGVYAVRFFSLAGIEQTLGKQGAALKRRVAQSCMTMMQQESYADMHSYTFEYWKYLSVEQREQLLLLCSISVLECRRDPRHLHAVIESFKPVERFSTTLLSLIQTILLVEYRLSQRQSVSLFAIQDQLEEEPNGISDECNLARLLVLAKLYLHEGDSANAITCVKQILGTSHTNRTPWINRCIAGAHLLLGRIAIQKKRYKEAESYFQYALNIVQESNFFASYAHACQCRCMICFHLGNLQTGFELASEVFEKSLQHVQHEWAIYFQFLRARFLFELGYYKRAQTVLEEEYSALREYFDEATRHLFSLWIARCQTYQNLENDSIERLFSLKESKERSLFLAEAYAMAKKYSDALPWIQEVISDLDSVEKPGLLSYPMYGESFFECIVPEYSSGFPVYVKMFHMMILALAEHTETIHETIMEIIRDDDFALTQSPYASMSCFFGSEALFAIRSSGSEGKSLLSKAMTAFKERFSQLYQAEARISFRSNHYWYSKLQKRAHGLYIT